MFRRGDSLDVGEVRWRDAAVEERLELLARFQDSLLHAREGLLTLLADLRPGCSRGELLSSEVIPLFDALRFLQREAVHLLKPKPLGRSGQPAWLWGVDSVIHREALGRILILAPGNYPLFLPMVCAVQAWAAGNSVWLKSAPGGTELHRRLQELFLSVGGDDSLFKLLGEDVREYPRWLEQVQKVVLVGSADTGRTVLSQAGEKLVPVVAELSGWDSVLIHPEACLRTAARAVAFGMSLNNGRTCVAPRRVLLRGSLEQFERHFQEAIRERPSAPLTPSERALIESFQDGTVLSAAQGEGPVLLSGVSADHELLTKEKFGAVSVLCQVESDRQALEIAGRCPFALGASLFGPSEWAQSLAHQVPAQMVSINDIIVPTADPRVPFGGSGRSGYGRMRGAEGLLELTQTRTVSVRTGGRPDHLLQPGPLDDMIVEKFLLMSHAPGKLDRVKALFQMIGAIAKERIRKRREVRRTRSC